MTGNRGKTSAEQHAENKAQARSLNYNRNFDTFIVAPCNQAAYNAAVAVADNSAVTHNPLFIHGGKYLGKTHLIYAIGNQLLLNNPEVNLCYCAVEKFIAEMDDSICNKNIANVLKNIRNADVLLMDDMESIERKEAAQEILFRIINDFYDSHKQIVITSSKLPEELAGIDGRLLALVERGLIVSILPADME
jgi:chromosomal replication initiator protein